MEIRFSMAVEGTEFQRRVWGVVAGIPYGETRSYSWVAQKAGGSPRAVGQALARNPYPLLIPCHRVVGKDGGLGGYTGGVDLKRKLLELEREAVERLRGSRERRPG
jgi:methylated-DNA-[protein]-cysteine S-methyltransferase